MIRTIPTTEEFNVLDMYDDEIDAAIASDKQIDAVLDSMKEDIDSLDIEDDDDDDVDIHQDYDDDYSDTDMEDFDADEIIDAEKDIIFDPFGDDEVIDAAIGDDQFNYDVLDKEDIDDINTKQLTNYDIYE